MVCCNVYWNRILVHSERFKLSVLSLPLIYVLKCDNGDFLWCY